MIGGQKQEGEDPLQVQRQQQLLEEEWLCRDEIQGLIHSFESKLRQFETNPLQIVETPMLSLLVGISTTKVSKQPVLPCFSGSYLYPLEKAHTSNKSFKSEDFE